MNLPGQGSSWDFRAGRLTCPLDLRRIDEGTGILPCRAGGRRRRASAVRWAPAGPQFSPNLISLPADWRCLSASNSQYERALGHLECVGLNLRQPLDAPRHQSGRGVGCGGGQVYNIAQGVNSRRKSELNGLSPGDNSKRRLLRPRGEASQRLSEPPGRASLHMIQQMRILGPSIG